MREGFNPDVKVGENGEGQFVDPEQPALPDMELVHIVESMTFPERVKYKRRLLSEISDRESLINLINDVNAAEDKDDSDLVIIY